MKREMTPMERFEAFARKLVSVPKAEIDAERKRDEAAKKRRRDRTT